MVEVFFDPVKNKTEQTNYHSSWNYCPI